MISDKQKKILAFQYSRYEDALSKALREIEEELESDEKG